MIRRLLSLTGPEHSAQLRQAVWCLGAAAAVQGVAFGVLLPVLRALVSGDAQRAWPWLAVLAIAVGAYAVLHGRGVVAGRRAGYALGGVLHERLGDHVVTLPLGWFTTTRVGSLGRVATQNVMSVMGVPGHLLDPLAQAVVTPATVVVVLLFADWRIAVGALVAAPVVIAAHRWTGRLVQRTDHAADAAGAEAGGQVVEFARNQPVLRAFGRGAQGFALLDDALVAARNAARRMLRTALPGLAGFVLTVQTTFTALLVLGAALATGADVDLPAIVVALVLAVRFTEPLLSAAELGAALRMAAGSLDRVEAVLAAAALPEPSHSAPVGPPSIEFDRVRFGYDDRPVLDDVTFTVAPGTTTALVGASGAGKSTVVRLVARFFDVDSGTVRVGGADVRELRTADLLGLIAPVFQDTYLFDTTLEDNIRLGRPGAADEEVHEAARLAGVTEIVRRLPDGWQTRVGEGGTRLSGGERQRVAIARALLKDAPIVLLDEATAALDAENEAAVTTALATLARGRTLLVIAHRLSTVVGADQIVVLDGGRVEDTGTHEELMERGGRYARFVAQRENARGWRIAAGRK